MEKGEQSGCGGKEEENNEIAGEEKVLTATKGRKQKSWKFHNMYILCIPRACSSTCQGHHSGYNKLHIKQERVIPIMDPLCIL